MSDSCAVIVFNLAQELHGLLVASGAITGKAHAEKFAGKVQDSDDGSLGIRLVFDFTGIELATASYIKASVLWFTSCGRMHAGIIDPEELRSFDASHFKPMNVFPVVCGINREIETELQEVFGGRGIACVAAIDWSPVRIHTGKVIGSLESTGIRTLKAIAGLSEFTAYDLQDRFPNEGVNATAWNNRLAELHRLRVLRRHKQGKFWKYQPVADQLTYG